MKRLHLHYLTFNLFALMLVTIGLVTLFASVFSILCAPWIGILMIVIFGPVCFLLLVFLIPIGLPGRMLNFLMLSPVPLGQWLPSVDKDEWVLAKQHMASGAFGKGLCGFNLGLTVILTNRQLILDAATTIPGVCLLALDLSEIQRVELARWGLRSGNRAVAISFTHDDHSTCLYFVPRDKFAWLQACEDAGLAVERPAEPETTEPA